MTVMLETPQFNLARLDPRVQAGVRFLDTEFPGWADQINLLTFNLRNCTRCVLGQVGGEEYDKVTHRFWKDAPNTRAAEKGFFSKNDLEDWELLERDWLAVIKARKTDS